MNEKQAIFIVGSERSGSNLLRVLLDNHSLINAPIAPHFLDTFSSFLRWYGNLKIQKNKKKLLTDLEKLANHEYNDWQLKLDLKNDKIKELVGFLEIYDYLYSMKAKKEGKIHYVSKGNHLFNYVFSIKSSLDNVKFLYYTVILETMSLLGFVPRCSCLLPMI